MNLWYRWIWLFIMIWLCCRSRTAVAPLERLKILLQVQNPHAIKYNGTIQGLKYIWRTEGFRGLFKGNGTNCARIVPNSAVKFFSYEEASKYVISFSFFLFPFFYFNMISNILWYDKQGNIVSVSAATWKWYFRLQSFLTIIYLLVFTI